MGKKFYNGISGILKIYSFVVVGLLIGIVAVRNLGMVITSMNIEYKGYIFSFFLLTLALAGYAGMLMRSILQIKSVFTADLSNKVVVFVTDIAEIISILSAYDVFMLFFTSFEERTSVMLICTYWGSLLLTLVDAVILCAEIRKEKIKILSEVNFLKITRWIAGTISALMVLCVSATLWGMIEDNIEVAEEMALIESSSESLKGSFTSFSMRDFEDNEYTEDMFKGHKVTMINIWATYCSPCIGEMPELEEIHQMYDEEQLQLVGMVGDLYANGKVDSNQIAKALLVMEKTGVTYPSLIPSLEIQANVIGKLVGFPTTIFLDENGEQIKVVVGGGSKERWIAEIEEVLANEE